MSAGRAKGECEDAPKPSPNTRRHARQHLAAVITIHDLNMALRFGDKFLFLKDKKVHAMTDRTGFSSELIEQVYDISVALHQCNGHLVVVPV